MNEKSGVGVRGLVQTKRMEEVDWDWQKTTTKNKTKHEPGQITPSPDFLILHTETGGHRDLTRMRLTLVRSEGEMTYPGRGEIRLPGDLEDQDPSFPS